MKRKGVLIVCLLALAAVCCACTGRVKQSGISARDPLTERTLTLNIAASYSPGDFDASGGVPLLGGHGFFRNGEDCGGGGAGGLRRGF